MDSPATAVLYPTEDVEILSPAAVRRILDEEAAAIEGNESNVLLNTMMVYGGIFVILFLVFCYVRRKYPRVYNLRDWLDDWKTPLAENQHGFFNWTSKMFLISDTDLMDECGMDALCFIRVLQFGFKLALFGMMNALWLIPVYATADDHKDTVNITDPVAMITTAHLPPGSPRFIATAIASYLIFGYAMFLILQEFTWFYSFRYRFLSKTLPRNYAVYVQCIPKEYQSNAKLLKFFKDSLSHDSVLDVKFIVKTPNLKKKVAQREKVIADLEHAINVEEITGVSLKSRSNGLVGPKMNLIDELYEELNELNKEISETITKIEGTDDSRTFVNDFAMMGPGSSRTSQKLLSGAVELDGVSIQDGDVSQLTTDDTSLKSNQVKKGAKELASFPLKGIKDVAGAAKGLLSSEDGELHSAAFVTFKSLRSAQAALQMLQHPQPFAMEALEAPSPEDVFWENTGKTHKELQLGKLFSLALTTTLCLFWTIPMSFISTLSTVEGLRLEVQFVDDLLNYSPWLVPVFAQLAPLLIIVANEVLKMILEALSMLEGPVSGAVVQSSLFSKLAAFMIIQTFFVSAISGSLFEALSGILDDPIGEGVPLLAKALPTKSTFFLQILLVDTFINLSIELLRVSAVAIAFIRSRVGPNLTEKERNTTWLGLRPLSDPLEFEHADVLSGSVLYFMVLFVYTPIAPLVTFFLGFCFLLMNACYRHQYVYVYPTFPDSGGHLWLRFFGIIPSCMLIAEITIFGMFGLSEAPIAASMMLPLMIVTVLFRSYISQRHFQMAMYLPARDATAKDLSSPVERDFDFVEGKYVQPELGEKELRPENGTIEREMNHGGDVYGTPNHSEVDEGEDAEREREFGSFAL